jgi:ceramide glucosyltransferase
MELLAFAVQIFTAGMTLGGIAYGVIALWGARSFEHETRAAAKAPDAPGATNTAVQPAGVSVLKPVRGIDPRMYAGLVSHCVQQYGGPYELVFGVSSMEDAAVGEIARLRTDYPQVSIQMVECPARLGTNGKVSNLAQMLPHAQYEHVLVNDSDILVSPRYLESVMAGFSDGRVGLVTVPYVGRAERGLWSRMEALGISTDFMAGVLTARKLEGGIRFGLGSTLATTKSALATIGSFDALVDQLADDYEMGARLCQAGYRVELVREVVATTVPAYTLRGFFEHQMRWARSTRDSRRAGYMGLGVTYVVPWAIATVLASGFSLWAISMLSVALLVRMSVALTVGVGILRDGQVLRDVWLLPLRDCFGLFFWAWSYASDEVVWRGERFRLRRGVLQRVDAPQ